MTDEPIPQPAYATYFRDSELDDVSEMLHQRLEDLRVAAESAPFVAAGSAARLQAAELEAVRATVDALRERADAVPCPRYLLRDVGAGIEVRDTGLNVTHDIYPRQDRHRAERVVDTLNRADGIDGEMAAALLAAQADIERAVEARAPMPAGELPERVRAGSAVDAEVTA